MQKTVLIDSNSLINRAFYAVPLLTDDNGLPTNAVLGYMNMLIKIFDEAKPTHIVAAFDVKKPTFRHLKCDYYKATRKPMPEDLAVQLPVLKEVLQLMGITICTLDGYEADDILGTLSRILPGEKVIVTGDRDCLQLVSDETTVWLTKKGISEVVKYTPARLAEDGFTPTQIIELKSLMGDSSDNIKGVPGVGEKTAKDLIAKYGSLDGVYDSIEEIKGKLREKLEQNRDIAYESRYLATINCAAPLDIDVDSLELKTPFPAEAKERLESLKFRSVIPKLDFAGKAVNKTFNSVNHNATKQEKAEKVSIFIDEDVHYSVDGETDVIIPLTKSLIDDGYDLYDALDIAYSMGEIVVLHDLKKHMRAHGTALYDRQVFDTYLAQYLISGGNNYEEIDKLFSAHGFSGDYPAAELFALATAQQAELVEKELVQIFNDVELPLLRVLYDMEQAGFKLDLDELNAAKQRYTAEVAEVTQQIYDAAGERFNINSTKQLGSVLFEKLGLPVVKKTKTGYSLTADVLEMMNGIHPIIAPILRYRKITKLLSTYIEGLLAVCDSAGRVHTEFKQGLTATGRLSSTEPNLQNIPVRTEEGQEIRKFFVAEKGNVLLCADYSQIELRLLAEFSRDKKLVDAYLAGEDIHRATAAAVNGVSPLEVTDSMRRDAKAVNFGIIYGISDFGLSENLGVSVKRAKQIIERYFQTYTGVAEYMEGNKAFARQNGYIRTFAGRLRYIPEIKSSNYNLRSFGERAAMNMPLQGASADIIKIAMIGVCKALAKGNYKARLILQVHDELIIECPVDEVEEVSRILKKEMENVGNFRVPLTVSLGKGNSWYEAK